MRKTKIICTMGPATDNIEVLESLVAEGMDVARFNFSHGTHEEQFARMERLREVRKKYNKPVAMLLDTKGPEIRVRDFKDAKRRCDIEPQGRKCSGNPCKYAIHERGG